MSSKFEHCKNLKRYNNMVYVCQISNINKCMSKKLCQISCMTNDTENKQEMFILLPKKG